MRTMMAITLGSLIAAPVHAQSAHPFQDHGRVESRAMLGVTIPLGGQKQKADTKPRFDLRIDTSRIDGDFTRAPTLDPFRQNRRDVRQSVVSLTMERQPRVMLNGFSLAQMGSPVLRADEEPEAEEGEDTKNERSTGEKVLRGAGWVGIGALGVLAVGAGIFLISCDDGDCFVDD